MYIDNVMTSQLFLPGRHIGQGRLASIIHMTEIKIFPTLFTKRKELLEKMI